MIYSVQEEAVPIKKFLMQVASAVVVTALTSAVNVYVSKKVADYMSKKEPKSDPKKSRLKKK